MSRLLKIKCTVSVTQPNAVDDIMITWEIAGQSDQSIDPSATWIASNNDAWVLLTKSVYWNTKGKSKDLYDQRLVYHSSESEFLLFNVTVVYNSFEVWNYEEESYTGWSSIGQIGGFWFYLVVMHTLAMVAVGVVLPNKSVFLRGEEMLKGKYQNINESSSQPSEGEKENILPK
eukprot:TRINITY_DN2044_c0_g1_i2.p1 TRINITY_DN2044_c0_g1~~TRINITY_DN2044_c0_g1_i2.p1  ORF type:complete len:174 (-),score=17.33 TRINITY_DN2044_c0_g1_i2:1-522(-)